MSRGAAVVIVAVAIGLVAMMAAAAAPGADEIVLRGSVGLEAGRTEVRLSDVATVTGPAAARFADVVVASLDGVDAGKTVRITLGEVRRALVGRGANLGLIAISGCECTVRRAEVRPTVEAGDEAASSTGDDEAKARDVVWAGDILNEPTLRGRIAGFMATQLLRHRAEDVELSFRVEDREALATSDHEFDFEIVPETTGRSRVNPLTITLYRGNERTGMVRLTVEARLRRMVVATVRPVGRGQKLEAEDLVEETRLIDPHVREPLVSMAAATGQEARGRLIAGQVLREGDVLAATKVNRNAEVMVTARIGQFVVTMPGRAMEAGRPGDVIKVRRWTDEVEIEARIEADGHLTAVQASGG